MRENRDIFSVYTIESVYNNIKVYAMGETISRQENRISERL